MCLWYIPLQQTLHILGIYEPLPWNISVTSDATASASEFRAADPLKLLTFANRSSVCEAISSEVMHVSKFIF